MWLDLTGFSASNRNKQGRVLHGIGRSLRWNLGVQVHGGLYDLKPVFPFLCKCTSTWGGRTMNMFSQRQINATSLWGGKNSRWVYLKQGQILRDWYLQLLAVVRPMLDQFHTVGAGERAEVGHAGRCHEDVAYHVADLLLKLLQAMGQKHVNRPECVTFPARQSWWICHFAHNEDDFFLLERVSKCSASTFLVFGHLRLVFS